jgi:hypothetical protein
LKVELRCIEDSDFNSIYYLNDNTRSSFGDCYLEEVSDEFYDRYIRCMNEFNLIQEEIKKMEDEAYLEYTRKDLSNE